MRRELMASAMAGLIATGAVATAHSPAQIKAAVTKALADPARADQAGDDVRRKAADVLGFSGVGPGDVVVDFLPGAKYYWTRIFSGIVGAKGKVYTVWPASAPESAIKTTATLLGWHLTNVTYAVPQDNSPMIGADEGKADVLWTVENYHDVANLGGEERLARFNKAVFDALKPGGAYVVIDHAGAAGTALTQTNTLHRIDPAAVKREVLAAGFAFVGESTVLRNPADDHSLKVFDPAIRGHTDQFVYKFRKPR